MSARWQSQTPAVLPPVTAMGMVRIVVRGTLLAAVVFGGLILLLLVRLIERPLCGLNRPVTPHITQRVCRLALRIMGLGLVARGTPMAGPGAVVANHTSWLDIFALNAVKRIYFVSKSEVAGWPGIGWLARATGTVFIERNPARAREQTEVFQSRLLAGHKLLFFPEGTSTDGMQVLPFKTTLFESFLAPELRDTIRVQPVAVVYHAPKGYDARFYGWWGDMTFGAHLLAALAARHQGSVTMIFLDPVNVADCANRKSLARACETAIRTAHAADLAVPRTNKKIPRVSIE